MIQIILGILIVLIGVFVFYKYPMKSDVKQMVLGALLVVLSIVLKRLAIMVPFLGFPSFKITLEVFPLIVAGLTLKPGYCYIVALATDGLGLILANAGGFPFFGFTLNAILQTLIPCFLKQNLVGEKWETKIDKIVYAGMSIIALAASLYVVFLNKVTISDQVFVITSSMKITIIAVVWLLIIVLFLAMYFCKKKISAKEYHQFNLVVMSVILIDLVVTFVLTPYWLDVMYGIPFFASSFLRMLKACVMIPVSIIVINTVYHIISRTLKLD